MKSEPEAIDTEACKWLWHREKQSELKAKIMFEKFEEHKSTGLKKLAAA